MTEFVEVLILPLSDSINHLVMHVLPVNDQVLIVVEDEVPRLGEVKRVIGKHVEVSAKLSLALSQLINDIMDDVTKIFCRSKDVIESLMLELVDETSKSFPQMLSITKAFSGVGHLGLHGASEDTLENFAHTEESEVNIGALHSLKVMHFFVFFMIDLVE